MSNTGFINVLYNQLNQYKKQKIEILNKILNSIIDLHKLINKKKKFFIFKRTNNKKLSSNIEKCYYDLYNILTNQNQINKNYELYNKNIIAKLKEIKELLEDTLTKMQKREKVEDIKKKIQEIKEQINTILIIINLINEIIIKIKIISLRLKIKTNIVKNTDKNLNITLKLTVLIKFYDKYYEKVINKIHNLELLEKINLNIETVKKFCSEKNIDYILCIKLQLIRLINFIITTDLNESRNNNYYLNYLRIVTALNNIPDNCTDIKEKNPHIHNFYTCVLKFLKKLFDFYINENKPKQAVSLISLIEFFTILKKNNDRCVIYTEEQIETILIYLEFFVKIYKSVDMNGNKTIMNNENKCLTKDILDKSVNQVFDSLAEKLQGLLQNKNNRTNKQKLNLDEGEQALNQQKVDQKEKKKNSKELLLKALNYKSNQGILNRKWKSLRKIINGSKNDFNQLYKKLSKKEKKKIDKNLENINNPSKNDKVRVYLNVMTEKSKKKHKCKEKKYSVKNKCGNQKGHCRGLCFIDQLRN